MHTQSNSRPCWRRQRSAAPPEMIMKMATLARNVSGRARRPAIVAGRVAGSEPPPAALERGILGRSARRRPVLAVAVHAPPPRLVRTEWPVSVARLLVGVVFGQMDESNYETRRRPAALLAVVVVVWRTLWEAELVSLQLAVRWFVRLLVYPLARSPELSCQEANGRKEPLRY